MAWIAFTKSNLDSVFRWREGLDAHEIQRKWREAGINIQLLSDFYYGDGGTAAGADSFVVNYSGIKRDSVAELVRRMESFYFS